MLLCMIELDFVEKKFLPQKWGKWAKQGFLNLLENLVINFFWIWSIKKVYINCCVLVQIQYLGSGSWNMGQNALGQSDCRIFKSTIFLEQNYEKAWFFECCYRFMEIKSWLKNFRLGLIKNGCDHSGLKTLKLAISQEGIYGINWFLVCW